MDCRQRSKEEDVIHEISSDLFFFIVGQLASSLATGHRLVPK